MRLLIVEDEKFLCDTVANSLRKQGYSLDVCYDGSEAWEKLSVEPYDLVVLDLNLPGMDGMTILKNLRENNKKTPVLILSARSEISDKVDGLDAGASDYLSKPFHLAELEARVRSLLRRPFTQEDLSLEAGPLAFDTKSRKSYVNGEELFLTKKEAGILEYLLLHMGRPVSQEELIEHVWDSSVDSFSNAIRVHISALRKKLKPLVGYDPVKNRIGEGYLIEVEDLGAGGLADNGPGAKGLGAKDPGPKGPGPGGLAADAPGADGLAPEAPGNEDSEVTEDEN